MSDPMEYDDHDHCDSCGSCDLVFSRVLCACDTMHYYCAVCGAQIDPCYVAQVNAH